ncbi:type II secretion system F family protein [Sphingomonas daechungensis]|uniref:type II secretion system F family protein n=1 Tax=Sphingomonas daechungensis TaxID=1176646 RepID=UPI001CB8EC6E|nr:type II secretion system F family protein [Sphingomonas daechungensis]
MGNELNAEHSEALCGRRDCRAGRPLHPGCVPRGSGGPQATGNHQRLPGRAGPDAGLRRGRPRHGLRFRSRRHGNDQFASAPGRAIRRRGARASRGRSHEDALRRMADRAGAEEIRAFATLLIQSSKLGSSIAQTLRVYAAEMRERRRMRAEEKAHRLPVLLSVPLVGCMLPVMIGVLMLPAAIRVIRSVVPNLGGG